jgi:outer membrane receptor protein involved in Fe transport
VADNFLGNYTFSGYATGNQVADMLLGYYSAAAAFVPGAFSVAGQAGNPRQFNFQYFAPYAQDDWRVNSRLTVNLGLRWDYRTIPYETNNRMGWLDPTNPLGGMCIADQGWSLLASLLMEMVSTAIAEVTIHRRLRRKISAHVSDSRGSHLAMARL